MNLYIQERNEKKNISTDKKNNSNLFVISLIILKIKYKNVNKKKIKFIKYLKKNITDFISYINYNIILIIYLLNKINLINNWY